jgi:hypothetical protein
MALGNGASPYKDITPEMRQAAQQFVAPVVVDDRFAYHPVEMRDSIGQPFRDVAAM